MIYLTSNKNIYNKNDLVIDTINDFATEHLRCNSIVTLVFLLCVPAVPLSDSGREVRTPSYNCGLLFSLHFLPVREAAKGLKIYRKRISFILPLLKKVIGEEELRNMRLLLMFFSSSISLLASFAIRYCFH